MAILNRQYYELWELQMIFRVNYLYMNITFSKTDKFNRNHFHSVMILEGK